MAIFSLKGNWKSQQQAQGPKPLDEEPRNYGTTLSNSDPISERERKWSTSRDQSQHLSDSSPSVSSLLEW